MVRRYLRIGAANDAVLLKPGGVKETKKTERLHHITTVEHVVDYALEVRPTMTHNITRKQATIIPHSAA